jgi:hypothetical protein
VRILDPAEWSDLYREPRFAGLDQGSPWRVPSHAHRIVLVTRLLDDLYWVMSYSRWQDERHWPVFRGALMREHPDLTEEGLAKARVFNLQRYYFQGIGRYSQDAAYARGLADLGVLADLVPAGGYVHGANPTSVDAGIYGFIANIYFYDIDTVLKQFVSLRENLLRHCTTIHETVMRELPNGGSSQSADVE